MQALPAWVRCPPARLSVAAVRRTIQIPMNPFSVAGGQLIHRQRRVVGQSQLSAVLQPHIAQGGGYPLRPDIACFRVEDGQPPPLRSQMQAYATRLLTSQNGEDKGKHPHGLVIRAPYLRPQAAQSLRRHIDQLLPV